MARKKWAAYQVGLLGWGVSLGLYGLGVMSLSYGLVAGWIPLSLGQMVLCAIGFFSVFLPSLFWGNQLGLGAMGGCLTLWLGFWATLFVVGGLCYGGLCVPQGGSYVIGCTLAGAVLAGGLSRKRRAKRLAKRLR